MRCPHCGSRFHSPSALARHLRSPAFRLEEHRAALRPITILRVTLEDVVEAVERARDVAAGWSP